MTTIRLPTAEAVGGFLLTSQAPSPDIFVRRGDLAAEAWRSLSAASGPASTSGATYAGVMRVAAGGTGTIVLNGADTNPLPSPSPFSPHTVAVARELLITFTPTQRMGAMAQLTYAPAPPSPPAAFVATGGLDTLSGCLPIRVTVTLPTAAGLSTTSVFEGIVQPGGGGIRVRNSFRARLISPWFCPIYWWGANLYGPAGVGPVSPEIEVINYASAAIPTGSADLTVAIIPVPFAPDLNWHTDNIPESSLPLNFPKLLDSIRNMTHPDGQPTHP